MSSCVVDDSLELLSFSLSCLLVLGSFIDLDALCCAARVINLVFQASLRIWTRAALNEEIGDWRLEIGDWLVGS
ncbi:hypothetical protein VNO78_04913 [Psophocarpus tetragonolobus]|uniref:Uncharacterized protein n=1 Tax=Psophocarpus tetragonolobus TaxID=3891 RepID=A0AAN9SRB4_PSOTE